MAPEYVLTAAHCFDVDGSDDIIDGFQIGALCDPYYGPDDNNCGQVSAGYWYTMICFS